MTPLWSAADLMAATGGAMTRPFAAAGISIDSRSLRPGDLFIALQGESDGHAHVAAAFSRGAAGAMVHAREVAADGPLLRVADTAVALTALGAAGRARYAGPVIAVTGSVGKTTTKEMLRRCLVGAHAAEASHNNHWGVPLTLARLPLVASGCVVEIGMNHAGEIAPLAGLAAPTVVIITNIGAAHVGHLGSLEAIADEKASIADGLAAGGVAILPADSEFLPRLRARADLHATATFGSTPGAYARLLNAQPDAQGSQIEASIGGQHVFFRLGAPGAHMVANALATLAAVQALGRDVEAAAARLAEFTPAPGRGQFRTLHLPGGEALLLDESYNASTASIRAALDVLALQPATRRIVVLGDIRELGDHSEAEHRSLIGPIAAVADVVFTCGIDTRHLGADTHAETPEALAPLVAATLRPGDAVLVKGSNGSRMGVVVEALGVGGSVKQGQGGFAPLDPPLGSGGRAPWPFFTQLCRS